MKKIVFLALTTCVCIILFGGCKESPLMAYNAGDRICFWEHAKTLSFYGATPEELPYDVIKVKLNIMGKTKDYDRTVTAEAVEDEPGTAAEDRLTTATADQYEILGGVILAGDTDGWFSLKVYNNDFIADNELRLRVRLTGNEYFQPGLKENQYMRFSWSAALQQPETWRAMRFFFCSTYSTQVYRLYMQVTGLKEFWYYNAGPDPDNNPEDRRVSASQGKAWAREFGDIVRAYNAEHYPDKMLHDDGEFAGTEIIPLY